MPLITNHCHLGVTAEAGGWGPAGRPRGRRHSRVPPEQEGAARAPGQPGHPRPASSTGHCPRPGRDQQSVWPSRGTVMKAAGFPQTENASVLSLQPQGLFRAPSHSELGSSDSGQLLIPPEMQKVCVHTVRGCIFPCRNSHPSMLVIP